MRPMSSGLRASLRDPTRYDSVDGTEEVRQGLFTEAFRCGCKIQCRAWRWGPIRRRVQVLVNPGRCEEWDDVRRMRDVSSKNE